MNNVRSIRPSSRKANARLFCRGALCTMRYTYDQQMYLLCIDEIVSEGACRQWERHDKIESLKRDLLALVSACYPKGKVKELKRFFHDIGIADVEKTCMAFAI